MNVFEWIKKLFKREPHVPSANPPDPWLGNPRPLEEDLAKEWPVRKVITPEPLKPTDEVVGTQGFTETDPPTKKSPAKSRKKTVTKVTL